MKIYLKSLKHYFLTVDTNGPRKKHMIEEFKDYDLTEVSPIKGIGKSKSGATGFSKMLDIALRAQERTKPFAPFILYEDDCSKYREYPEYIDIPDDADVCYIGLSMCSMNETSWHHGMYYKHIDSEVVQIYNMLALHGIMICSASGALAIQKAVLEGYYKNMIWDIFTAQIQSYYKFYALKEPLVFQDIAYGGAQYETKIKISSHGNDVPLPEKFINTTNDSIIMTCCHGCHENATNDSIIMTCCHGCHENATNDSTTTIMNPLFEAVLYINLAHRTDRKEGILKQLEQIPSVANKTVPVHRIEAALEPLCGHLGCGKSHVMALELAMQHNWWAVLVVEDDFCFTEHYQGENSFASIAPIKWDVMLLAKGHQQNKDSQYDFLKKACMATTTSGYIVRRHYYPVLLDNFKQSVLTMTKEYERHAETCVQKNEPVSKLNYCSAIDQYWFSLQDKDTFYMFEPPIGNQNGQFWSDNNCTEEHQRARLL